MIKMAFLLSLSSHMRSDQENKKQIQNDPVENLGIFNFIQKEQILL